VAIVRPAHATFDLLVVEMRVLESEHDGPYMLEKSSAALCSIVLCYMGLVRWYI